MRTKIEWRSASRESYNDFCEKNKDVKLTFDEWKTIIYGFNESFRDYILETGEKIKFPYGFGEFSINKKRRKPTKGPNDEFINLPVNWVETRKRGKLIYNFNYHTEGFFFGWMWFKNTARIRNSDIWFFKPTRATSRLLAHYLNVNEKYQHLYNEWKL